ncbi:PQQ-dependent sugar dehydrogenase [Roseovarius spongiae]|uniref:PQQ-dependent sugar dehydrogenase n=1 Tax=Roseovarius spongiae TaxID=2320272 RepID=A0A3A8AYA9_9RHOB|nr:PQQ-dependent sugar dehydrogenase [Roseovarius spongiae]RKF16937.1 PQQ-dependent sugar dehydrogenase [Roseovarius spongiae]
MFRSLIAAAAILLSSGGAAIAQTPFGTEPVATFDRPWAVAPLPQGGFLVTEKAGRLVHVSETGERRAIEGTPKVRDSGQVGLLDVALAPDFTSSRQLYLTWVDGADGGALHLGRGRLDPDGVRLAGFNVIWRAAPTGGRGHPGAMIAFGPDGRLFLSSGDRQLGDPAQEPGDSRGKILRLTQDGAPAAGNPFPDAPEVWSLGHRNPYGLVFDPSGTLWSHEMGPRGGDELNVIEPGANYGWPLVSEGRRYSGLPIPDHDTRPEFVPPVIEWSPVITPAGMIHYDGATFPEWRGSLLIGGLASRALIRVEIADGAAHEAERWDMGHRIRDVAAGADGAVYLLEDGQGARLLRLTRDD